MADLNALNPVNDINNIVEQLGKIAAPNGISPQVFYQKQLLDTIRLDAEHYKYYKYAEESPIQNKADKLTIRRWSPLKAHTTPLAEGIPPKSDKGAFEKYEISAMQYGRYMEFTDKVSFKAVDPVIAHYTKEYSIVAMETLDLLARKALIDVAQKRWAAPTPGKPVITDFDNVELDNLKPTIADLRLIALQFKKTLVKPRSNGKYHAIVSPEFVYDMLDDPFVQNYMKFNQTTHPFYEGNNIVPMFGIEFIETQACIASGRFVNAQKKQCVRAFRETAPGVYEYKTWTEDNATPGQPVVWVDEDGHYDKWHNAKGVVGGNKAGYDTSYLPGKYFNFDTEENQPDQDNGGWKELKIQHIIVLGKDALTRTGLAGEGNAKMYVKALGSAGVLDPIDQRQSIGFKINSVGFGSTRLEAIVDYLCVPSQLNF